MAIFHEYVNHKYRGFINWYFDDGNGGLSADKDIQRAHDFKELGKSYLANALIVNFSIIKDENKVDEADKLLLPVFFDIWHGLELLLKSGNICCDLLLKEKPKKYIKHNIYTYFDCFKEKLRRLDLDQIFTNHLTKTKEFIDELNDKNASFDFGRYTTTSSEEQQFYNSPDEDGIIPNTCIDLFELNELLLSLIEELPIIVNYLNIHIECYGTDTEYLNYKEFQNFIEENDDENDVPKRFDLSLIMKCVREYLL